MITDRQRIRRDFLMTMHTIAYGLLWVSAFNLSIRQTGISVIIPIVLMWTLIYVMHVRQYQREKALRDVKVDDRQAYRDGFNAAVHMMRENENIPDRLMLDSDGELIEEPVTEKRKYR